MSRLNLFRRYALTVALLLAALATVLLQIGTAHATEPQVYVVQPGDSLVAIAERFGTTVEAIVRANNIADPDQIAVGQMLQISAAAAPAAAPEVPQYTVQSGDTLTKIAERFDTTIAALFFGNELENPNLIVAGQVLAILTPEQVPDLPAVFVVPPVVIDAEQLPPKGLAMALSEFQEDLALLGVSWWYDWQWCTATNCVPMVYEMQLPPACTPVLLVGNEPNARPPFGSTLTPEEAAERVIAIEAMCPEALLVVGNVSADDWSGAGGWGSGYDWLIEFLTAYQTLTQSQFDQVLGVHCYSTDAAAYCIEQLATLRELHPRMWVTEFGIVTGNPDEFQQLLDYVAATFERYAVYTNRQPHTGEGWELDPTVELVGEDGMLTPIGQIYAEH